MLKNILMKIWPINKLIEFLWWIKKLTHVMKHAYEYDKMISDLQLAVVEQACPGNRARLNELKDSHTGERCFIIGNGSSLTAADLELLRKHGEFCFASNRIHLIYEQTDWRPDIWAAVDYYYINWHKDEVQALNGYTKILSALSIVEYNDIIDDAIYIPHIYADRWRYVFYPDIRHGCCSTVTVTLAHVNMAVYMGFSEIYLLGVDNDFPTRVEKDGTTRPDPTRKHHFSDKYVTPEIQERARPASNGRELATEAYQQVKRHCDNLGIKIFNATRGGNLEVYERVKLEDVLNNRHDLQRRGK